MRMQARISPDSREHSRQNLRKSRKLRIPVLRIRRDPAESTGGEGDITADPGEEKPDSGENDPGMEPTPTPSPAPSGDPADNVEIIDTDPQEKTDDLTDGEPEFLSEDRRGHRTFYRNGNRRGSFCFSLQFGERQSRLSPALFSTKWPDFWKTGRRNSVLTLLVSAGIPFK